MDSRTPSSHLLAVEGDGEEAGRTESVRSAFDIFDVLPDVVTVQDADGRLIYANSAAAAALGYSSPDELVAAPPGEIVARYVMWDEDGNELPAARLPGRLALRGEEPPELVVRHRHLSSGEERWAAVRARPLRDERGRVEYALNIARDITRQKRAEEALRASETRLSLLASATPHLLAASRSYETALERVADLVVPALADMCAVRLVSDDGSVRRVAVRHADPRKVELVRRLESYADAHDRQVLAAVKDGDSIFMPDVPHEVLLQAAENEEHLALLEQVGVRSAIVVPLRARGRCLGVISMAMTESGRTYERGDLALAEELAQRAASAMDNALLYRQIREIAATLQSSLLPPELPDVPGFDLAAFYRPATDAARIGGDFYDVFKVKDSRIALAVGDVCGKGLEAAALTAQARYTLRAVAAEAQDPRGALLAVNDQLKREASEINFCTLVYAEIALGSTPVLRLACAGHPPPLVLRADARVETAGTGGMPLGLFADPDIGTGEVKLAPGDAVVFYTDGVLDARSGDELFGEERLAATLAESVGAGAAEIAARLKQRVSQFALGTTRDDMAVIVAEARP